MTMHRLMPRPVMAVMAAVTLAVMLATQVSVVLAQEEHNSEIPDWVRETAEGWLEGEISDGEFLDALTILSRSELARDDVPGSMNVPATEAGTASMAAPVTPLALEWMEARTEWWLDGKITDGQFMSSVHHFGEAGYLNQNGMQGTELGPKGPRQALEEVPLGDLLLTELEIDRITKVSKWRFVSTEEGFDKTEGATDSVRVLMRDVSRVYDPVFNKYKIPTMSMSVTRLSEQAGAYDYWANYTNQAIQALFESAHMTGRVSDGIECIFGYSDEGAVTACAHNGLIIQVVIFDAYGEHYQYKTPNIEIDRTEPTTSIMDGIIRKIFSISGSDAYSAGMPVRALQEDSPVNDAGTPAGAGPDTDVTDAAKNATGDGQHLQTGPEASPRHGMTGLFCSRDDFGTITITGAYTNDNVPRNKTDVEIVFVDWNENIIGRTSISFTSLGEFETKRFYGHVKWDGNFALCKTP
ncbi:MAG: hypothetical protein OXI27_03055 [Thaumarchaeota archaeon]|nr:hypothetical protein [Nitrososphaerota archaeon]